MHSARLSSCIAVQYCTCPWRRGPPVGLFVQYRPSLANWIGRYTFLLPRIWRKEKRQSDATAPWPTNLGREGEGKEGWLAPKRQKDMHSLQMHLQASVAPTWHTYSALLSCEGECTRYILRQRNRRGGRGTRYSAHTFLFAELSRTSPVF